jgi:hypothetical protein
VLSDTVKNEHQKGFDMPWYVISLTSALLAALWTSTAAQARPEAPEELYRKSVGGGGTLVVVREPAPSVYAAFGLNAILHPSTKPADMYSITASLIDSTGRSMVLGSIGGAGAGAAWPSIYVLGVQDAKGEIVIAMLTNSDLFLWRVVAEPASFGKLVFSNEVADLKDWVVHAQNMELTPELVGVELSRDADGLWHVDVMDKAVGITPPRTTYVQEGKAWKFKMTAGFWLDHWKATTQPAEK